MLTMKDILLLMTIIVFMLLTSIIGTYQITKLAYDKPNITSKYTVACDANGNPVLVTAS